MNILSEIKGLYFMYPSYKDQEYQNTLQDNDVLSNVFASQQYAMLTSVYEKSIRVRCHGQFFNTHMTSDLYINSCKTLFDVVYTQKARFAV